MYMQFFVTCTEEGCSSKFTEKQLLEEMKKNEIAEDDYKVLVDHLKKVVYRIAHH